jgi:hypothetical protein
MVDPPDVRPYGALDESQVAALEFRLGRRLPPAYRAWLAATNGAYLMGEHGVPGLPFTLFEERPLLGVQPQYQPFDLLAAETLHRRPWLSANFLVVAVPSGGLLAVRLTGPAADAVVFLPEEAMTGQPGSAADAARERHLVPVAPYIAEFGRRLTRF